MRCLCFVLFLITASNAAKILGIFPMPAPSHFMLGSRLLKELASRGHEVTMISMFPQKTKIPNYTDVELTKLMEGFEGDGGEEFSLVKMPNLFSLTDMSIPQQLFLTSFIGSAVAELTIKHPNVQKLLKSNEKFDLVIAEQFFNEIHAGFAHKYNCPYIILSTMGSTSWLNGLVSNPAPYSYVPDLFLQYSSSMNFWERLHNVYYGLIYETFREFYYLPKQDLILHQHFPDAPPLMDVLKNNLSMILLNSYATIADPVPHVPSMVEIGGFHVEDSKPLPKDLKDFMDNAKEGVILFSMGSNLKSADLPLEKRDAILKTFSKLKQKVIWKWEDDSLPGQPKNVKLSKWLPQNDIMAHPNLRAFLTHGGLLSTIEALHHGVPIVCIPIFGDQKMNTAQAVLRKYGLAVYFEDLTEEKLSKALNEILTNPTYRDNMRKRSMILRDQPLRPIDHAVFWVEHVIRHKGAEHFKSASRHLHWTQMYLLDVIAFSIGIALLFVSIVVLLCRMCLCRKKPVAKKEPKKKKQ